MRLDATGETVTVQRIEIEGGGRIFDAIVLDGRIYFVGDWQPPHTVAQWIANDPIFEFEAIGQRGLLIVADSSFEALSTYGMVGPAAEAANLSLRSICTDPSGVIWFAGAGINTSHVTKVVIGHAHWDHAGQLSDLPNAVLYVQREELKAIEWALNYPEPHIRAVNSDPGGCNRTPAWG